MTDSGGPTPPQYRPGDVANGHILTAAGWMPLRRLPHGAPGPYYAGDCLNGKAFTGREWVTLPPPNLTGAAGAPQPTMATPQRLTTPQKSTKTWPLIAVGIGILTLTVFGFAVAVVSGDTDSDQGVSVSPASPSPSPTSKPNTSTPTPTPRPTAPTVDPDAALAKAMEEKGWMRLSDEVWGAWEEGEADMFSYSWRLRVIAPEGCRNGIYVAGTIEDETKTVIGYANDLLPSLAPNQQAVMKLTTMLDGGTGIRISDVSCY